MPAKNLKTELKRVLSEAEMRHLVTSFDMIGSIAVIDIPPQLEHKQKEIAEAILRVHSSIKTVCRRSGIHSGIFRIRPVEVVAGENTTETYYKESGARMHLDINRVYFTPRLSFERSRIANLVKDGETIGAWFAGVGPFALVIAKNNPRVKIYAIELNPDAFNYLVENVRINRMQEVIFPVLGDVREKAKELPQCDRIIMPLPKGAETFLDAAFERINQNGVIHFYAFGDADSPFEEAEKKVFKAAEKQSKKVEIAGRRIVRPYSPSIVQVVFDILCL